MGKLRRKEDAADKWLREHDPYYLSKDKKKMAKEKYSYETPRQEERRRKWEIPISCLSMKQKREIDT